MNRILVAACLVLGLAAAGRAIAASGDRPSAPDRAQSLQRQALAQLGENTVDSRRQAVRALEEANRLAPGDAEIELTLARAYYASGFLQSARQHFEHASLLEPDDAAGHLGLGRIWKRDWLQHLDHESLDRAVQELVSATILDTSNVDAWLELEPLLIAEDNVGAALVAAFRAAKTDPTRLDAHLAVASVCWRVGLEHDADSIFAYNIPFLPGRMRQRFARFDSLPGRVELWARATQAYFLFYDPKRGDWDERGDVYVHYGPPAEMQHDPVTERHSSIFAVETDFPLNVQVWSYPELGLTVKLEDRTLAGRYSLPLVRVQPLDPADLVLALAPPWLPPVMQPAGEASVGNPLSNETAVKGAPAQALAR
ncbi:MAG TPA: tetratricopeptide repeat protein [Terriglobales bacterium]|nr:tetratricopeptide repeat protein [Terriglobales bacterium]